MGLKCLHNSAQDLYNLKWKGLLQFQVLLRIIGDSKIAINTL